MIKLRDNVFVGGYKDVEGEEAARELHAQGITAVLNVAYEIDDPAMHPIMVRTVKIGLTDSSENPDYMKHLAVQTAQKLMDEGEVVLVHCAAGLSRSVYTAVMAVANKEDKDWHDVFDELKKDHPFAMVGPLFHGENRLYQHYKDLEDGTPPAFDESTAQTYGR